MIGKVCQRGSDVRRLLGYLFREGLAGEPGLSAPHTDAHLIAGWDGVDGLEPPHRAAGGGRDLGTLAAALNAPLLAAGLGRQEWQRAQPVYHLAISAAEQDRQLSDAEWADVVGEYVDRIGLAPRGDEDAVRWVAVRHADNHVHVVATLARQDGKRVWPRNDFYRAREASLAVEARYRLTPTSPADRTGDRQVSRAEQRSHTRQVTERVAQGRPAPVGPDREVLRGKVRAALAGARGFEEFSERLSLAGVLVRPRMSTRDPQEMTGYAVALRASGGEGAEPVWFGGGKRTGPDLAAAARPVVPRTRRAPPRRGGRQRGAGRCGARASRASGVVGGRRTGDRPGRGATTGCCQRGAGCPRDGGSRCGRRKRGPRGGRPPDRTVRGRTDPPGCPGL